MCLECIKLLETALKYKNIWQSALSLEFKFLNYKNNIKTITQPAPIYSPTLTFGSWSLVFMQKFKYLYTKTSLYG